MPGPNAVMWCRPRSFPASAGLSRRMIPPPPQKLARPPAPDRKTDDAAGPDQAGGFAGIINPNAEVVIVEIADSAIGARHLCRFNSRMFWCVRTAAVVATLMRPEGLVITHIFFGLDIRKLIGKKWGRPALCRR